MVGVIYALRDARGVRYVGQTVGDVRRRLCEHQRKARKGSHLPVHRWLRKLDGDPELVVLQRAVRGAALDAAERSWIAVFSGPELLNVAIGGAGGWRGPHSAETKAKLRIISTGRKQSPEAVERLRTAQMGHPVSPEARAKIGAANSGPKPPRTAAHRANLGAAHKGRPKGPEHRAKLAAALRGRPRVITDEHRRNMAVANRLNRAKLTPEQVYEIRQSAEISRVLAVRYGVSRSTVADARTGRKGTWADVPFPA